MTIYNLTTKLGFSAEYIEKISPAERELYISYYKREKEEEEKKKKHNSNTGPVIGKPIGD